MKISIHPVLLYSSILLVSVLTAGCPVSIGYPLCEEDKVEKLDRRLIGTWKADSESAEILEVSIQKEEDNDLTFAIEVLEQGENYMAEDTEFRSWITKLDGHSFIFSKAVNADKDEYYLYEYSFEGQKLVIQDVSLLIGGIDGVTSTETFREEVSASLKKPDCLTDRQEYTRQ